MSQFWYVERRDEVLVDLDRARPLVLNMVQRRLEAAIACEALVPSGVYLYPSTGDDHYHLYITLHRPLDQLSRIQWALRFGDDRNRAAQNLRRYLASRPAVSLLIEPGVLPEYPRVADFVCECEGKHTAGIMRTCPTGRLIRRDGDPMGTVQRDAVGPAWRRLGNVWKWNERVESVSG